MANNEKKRKGSGGGGGEMSPIKKELTIVVAQVRKEKK